MVGLAIDRLAVPLDRSRLHVFVAGPGYGEGIAVAMPERGWIVVDGCQISDGRLPLLAVLDRWRTADEPVDALLLTHPHSDHAFGIREMIEEVEPLRIGLTTSPSTPERVFTAILDPTAASGPLERQHRRVVQDALLAIQQRLDSPADLLPLVDGTAVPVSSAIASASVRSPEPAIVEAWLRSGVRSDPNELSAVIEIAFGDTRVVLGSDLPTFSANGRALAGGWNQVMPLHPQLGAHHGLKIPHHGSPMAFHPELMSPGRARAWWISPFNRGKRLPPTEPDGVPRLVNLNGEVSLTATPRRRAEQPVHMDPGRVTLAELAALFTPSAPMLPGALAVTPPVVEPLEPLWCGAFDAHGALVGAWRGTRAFTVIP